jgi:hypothetical protein
MDTTTLLAQLWGPILLAIGFGIFISREYYVRVYRDLEKSPLAVLLFGMVAMTAGIAQIQMHTLWDTVPQIIISLLGFVDKKGDAFADMNLIPAVGVALVIAGAYLSWISHLA